MVWSEVRGDLDETSTVGKPVNDTIKAFGWKASKVTKDVDVAYLPSKRAEGTSPASLKGKRGKGMKRR